MKTKSFFLTLALLLTVTAVGAFAATINQTVTNINADSKKEGGPAKVLQTISASTHVPVATLEKQKAKTNLSYGELFIAHSIAKASGKSFDEIAALKSKGQSWDKIAADHNVDLGGKKKSPNATAMATPKPSATPAKKTLRQEQAERYQ